MISMSRTSRTLYINTVVGIAVFLILAAASFGLWALVNFFQMLLRIWIEM
ncbi:hypothetical protein BofuT4_uP110950.1 [Botrytis cinerea T4]|uniref:Uncharacterized protein n=1 Tax=Botryotinia fuckeliana (strain T4) TaxID=999810 RepID=G2Y630_BOTF4|nr:hypothetical protein BofuT4_uP110950.1 [Botrytis cinerea T4]